AVADAGFRTSSALAFTRSLAWRDCAVSRSHGWRSSSVRTGRGRSDRDVAHGFAQAKRSVGNARGQGLLGCARRVRNLLARVWAHRHELGGQGSYRRAQRARLAAPAVRVHPLSGSVQPRAGAVDTSGSAPHAAARRTRRDLALAVSLPLGRKAFGTEHRDAAARLYARW